jgi:protein TonB
VRCVGCEIDKSAESDYCECCGRRLSLSAMLRKGPGVFGTRQASDPERSAARDVERTAVRELEGASAAEQNPALDGRCETCGAASPDGGLCPSCQQAFNAWLGNAETSTVSDPTTPSSAAAANETAVASEAPDAQGAAPVEESLWSQLMNSPAPPPDDSLYMPDPVEKVSVRRASTMVADDNVPAPTTEAVEHEDALQVASAEAIVPEPVKASEPIRLEEEKPLTAASIELRSESTLDPQPSKPSVVPLRPTDSVPSQPKRNSVPLAAAAGFVVALGVGAYWIPNHVRQEQVVAREEQPPVAASEVTVTAPQPPAAVPPAEPVEARKPLVTAKAPPTARPKQTVAKEVRTPNPAVWPVAAAAPAPEPVFEAPAPVVVAPPPPPVVASAPPPAAPSGQFFETTDVSESPQVTKRVEPQLPDELRNRRLSEIIVVRILVSQSGHPYRISLLRKSKTGPQLDKAVIAAVNQWTFSPAKRRGEAVSCWLNFGVPVSAS